MSISSVLHEDHDAHDVVVREWVWCVVCEGSGWGFKERDALQPWLSAVD